MKNEITLYKIELAIRQWCKKNILFKSIGLLKQEREIKNHYFFKHELDGIYTREKGFNIDDVFGMITTSIALINGRSLKTNWIAKDVLFNKVNYMLDQPYFLLTIYDLENYEGVEKSWGSMLIKCTERQPLPVCAHDNLLIRYPEWFKGLPDKEDLQSAMITNIADCKKNENAIIH